MGDKTTHSCSATQGIMLCKSCIAILIKKNTCLCPVIPGNNIVLVRKVIYIHPHSQMLVAVFFSYCNDNFFTALSINVVFNAINFNCLN